MKKTRSVESFYEIRKKMWKYSLLLFILVIGVYFLFMGALSGFVLAVVFIVFRPDILQEPRFMQIIVGSALLASFLLATFHYIFARLHGANTILKILDAQKPDPNDLYHKRFVNMVEELRIATGLPDIDTYIIPSPAVNSMSLIQSNGRPAIISSEGILGKCSRAELQAAMAHELAHIIKGDTFILTLVCSMRALFDKVCQKLQGTFDREESETVGGRFLSSRAGAGGMRGGGGYAAAVVLIVFCISFTAQVFMNILTTFLSRKREIVADATAVEITRDPLALAMAIYKAHTHHSFLGSFCASYTPLFIVSPDSRGYSLDSSFIGRFWDSHPPLKKRLEVLAGMANVHFKQILTQYWEQKENRKNNPTVSLRKKDTEMFSEEQHKENQEGWEILDDNKNWTGPYPLMELVRLSLFAPNAMLRNSEHGLLGEAASIPQLQQHLSTREKGSRFLCPVCHLPLQDIFYEGVPIYQCPQGHGKSLTRKQVTRIVLREEMSFCEELREKAKQLKKQYLINPQKTGEKEDIPLLQCPGCSREMKYRPFNYQYYLMVYECYLCGLVWFEGQLLEVLQIFIEEAGASSRHQISS